jgi:hypothetical protein
MESHFYGLYVSEGNYSLLCLVILYSEAGDTIFCQTFQEIIKIQLAKLTVSVEGYLRKKILKVRCLYTRVNALIAIL